MKTHTARLVTYIERYEPFKRLRRHFWSTISVEVAVSGAGEEAYPYNLLRALKFRSSPTDQSRKISNHWKIPRAIEKAVGQSR